MLLTWAGVMREAEQAGKTERFLDLVARDVIGLRAGELGQHQVEQRRYRSLLSLTASRALDLGR